MVSNSKEENENCLKGVIHRFDSMHSVADKTSFEFSQFVENESITSKYKFIKFDKSHQQLDLFCLNYQFKLENSENLLLFWNLHLF